MAPYTPPFIPRSDALLSTFAQAFAGGLVKDPAKFGLAPAQAQFVMDVCNRFVAALGIARNPKTRTEGTICEKNNARSILRDQIQTYAAIIRAFDGVVDSDKIDIGVRPRNVGHKQRKCPITQPLLNFIGSLPGLDQLCFHDANNPTSKAKPFGAERLELWVSYNPAAPLHKQPPEDARLVGSFKKCKMLVEQDPSRDVRLEGNSKPTYWARWVGFNGDVGPWSLTMALGPAAEEARKERQAKKQREAADDDQSLKLAA